MDEKRRIDDAVAAMISGGTTAENDELRALFRQYGYNPVTPDDIYELLEELDAVNDYFTVYLTEGNRENLMVLDVERENVGLTPIEGEDEFRVYHHEFMNYLRGFLKNRHGY